LKVVFAFIPTFCQTATSSAGIFLAFVANY